MSKDKEVTEKKSGGDEIKPWYAGLWRRGRIFNAVFVLAAFVISVTCVLTGGYVSGGYELSVGSVSERRIQSPQDVINELATKALQDQAAEKARSNIIYKQDNNVTNSVMHKLDMFFEDIEGMRRLHNPIINPALENQTPVQPADLDRSRLTLDITNTHFNFMIVCGGDVFKSFKDTIREITEARLTSGIKEDALYSISLGVKDELSEIEEWDTVVKNAGYSIISQVLKANIFLDADNMEKAALEAIAGVEPVVIYKGQNIIDIGSPVTPEIYTILESLGLVRTTMYDKIPPVIGALLTVTAVFIAGISFFVTIYKQKLSDKKNVVLLFVLYSAAVIISWMLKGMSFVFMPILLFTMLAAVLLDEGLAVGFNLCLTVVAAVVCLGDMKFISFFILSGLLVSITAKLITERNKLLSVTAIISGFSAAVICAVYLVADGVFAKDMWDAAVIAALYSMFSVVFCVGVLPFFETVFGFVTTIKLADLANPSNPLLRRLIIEAPGTYQHSLIVGNLAETACYSIGANHTLARVGGYYHDVGKLNYPYYFIENVNGPNPHDTMDPRLSAKIITEHVANGLELANQHKLPRIIRAFIEEHHGGSLQKYFYYKAKKENPDIEILESDYRYNYPVPRSREAAVVMLADTAEAAVRSVASQGHSSEELRAFIAGLVKSALDENRLRDSGLTIKNLDTIVDAFVRVFRGMYHERVKYPDSDTSGSKPTESTAGETKEDAAAGESSGAMSIEEYPAEESGYEGLTEEAETSISPPECMFEKKKKRRKRNEYID